MTTGTTPQSKALAAYRTWKLWIEPERLVLRRVLRGSLRDVPAREIAQGLRVGLEATMILTAAFLSATRGWHEAKRVLNISSGLGRHPMASQAVYCAAKAGMDLYTRCVALEEAQTPNGAHVCALAPGVIDTDMQVQLRGAAPTQFPDQERFAALKSSGALVSPADTARRILDYLARPDYGQEPVADIRDHLSA